MVILDANMIPRYLLNYNEEMANRAENCIRRNDATFDKKLNKLLDNIGNET